MYYVGKGQKRNREAGKSKLTEMEPGSDATKHVPESSEDITQRMVGFPPTSKKIDP